MAYKRRQITLPISDTIPGPGCFSATMIDSDDLDSIPAIEGEFNNDHFGHGTTEDIHTVSHPNESTMGGD